jgi:glyoxylase-like metal-dependent hydrolase (beta-lactamase superfamily II)
MLGSKRNVIIDTGLNQKECLDAMQTGLHELDVDLVLPGHRRLFRNHRERIAELKKHHRKRAKEVLQILDKGPMNAFQVASEMTWNITYESWEQFPVQGAFIKPLIA